LASVFGAGLAPIIALSLLTWADGDPWPVAVYMIALALVTLVSVYLASETFQSGIAEEQPQERQIMGAEDRTTTDGSIARGSQP
jgi:LPS O-antigen subunit length determinant protein (WzzB/FepE family)